MRAECITFIDLISFELLKSYRLAVALFIVWVSVEFIEFF
jgi:hypothetical protein